MPGTLTQFAAHRIPLHTPAALLCALALGVGGHALELHLGAAVASSAPAGSVAGEMEVGDATKHDALPLVPYAIWEAAFHGDEMVGRGASRCS